MSKSKFQIYTIFGQKGHLLMGGLNEGLEHAENFGYADYYALDYSEEHWSDYCNGYD